MKKLVTIILTCSIIFSVFTLASCNDTETEQPKKVFPTSVWDGETIDTSWYSAVESELSIDSADQFAGFAKLVNEGISFSGITLYLNANIDLGGHEWTPIGTLSGITKYGFEGVFKGNNCSIYNFKITNTSLCYIGLFGINHGIINNLSVSNFEIKLHADVDNIYVGGLTGLNEGQIDTCYANGKTDVYAYSCKAGMLVGLNNNASIYNCYSDGELIAGDYAAHNSGGLVGRNSQGVISGCYSLCKVSAMSKNSDCYAGGLVGSNSGAIYDSFAVGAVSSESGNSYHNSTFQNKSSAGGLVGYNANDGSITNSYRLIDQLITADKINNHGTAVTANDLKSEKFYSNTLNWSSSIWIISSSEYPKFK